MSNSRKVTQGEITDFLTKILTIGGNYIVTPDGGIRLKDEPDTPIQFEDPSGKKRTWYVYSTDIKDPNSIILNPMIEITGKDMTDNKLPANLRTFYSTLSTNIALWVWKTITIFIEGALGKIDVPASIVEDVSKISTKVDEKMLTELNQIVEASRINFCNIYYDRIKQKTTLKICFDDDTGEALKAFPKLRKKSRDTFIDLIHILFDVEDDKHISEVYTAHSTNMKFPHFESYFTVFIKVWKRLAKYASPFDDYDYMLEDIKVIEQGFEEAEFMRSMMRWSSPSSVVDKPKGSIKIPSVKAPSGMLQEQQPISSPAPVTTNSPTNMPLQTYPPQTQNQPLFGQQKAPVDGNKIVFSRDGGVSSGFGNNQPIQNNPVINQPIVTGYQATPPMQQSYAYMAPPPAYGYPQQQMMGYPQQPPMYGNQPIGNYNHGGMQYPGNMHMQQMQNQQHTLIGTPSLGIPK